MIFRRAFPLACLAFVVGLLVWALSPPPAVALDATNPAVAPRASVPVTLPVGYRTWRHVKSMIIQPGHALAGLVEGTHHIYANAAAMRGYEKRPFPDGAIIVFDLLTTEVGDKAIAEGARKAVIVMQKDARRYAATGGWGFEVFAGGKGDAPQVKGTAREACFTCHLSEKARDYVFSDYRD